MIYRIHPTARRHGIADDDILHVIEHASVIKNYEDNRVLYIGPGQAANLLEIVTLLLDRIELVIHAMKMRSKYEPLLREYGDSDA